MGKRTSLILILTGLLVGLFLAAKVGKIDAADGATRYAFLAKTEFDGGTDSAQSGSETACGTGAGAPGACREVERRILAATLRIEIHTWILSLPGQRYASFSGDGYGTVMSERYLLTHNHYDLPLRSLLADDANRQWAYVDLYSAAGERVWHGSLAAVAIAYEDPEALLLDFQGRDGRGLFAALDIPAAEFATRGAAAIAPGAPLAQVNWDRHTAFVQWATVGAVSLEGDTPTIQLATCITPGASGGGVFFNGVHVANNWQRSNGCVEASGDAEQRYSVAVFNSALLLASGRS